MVALRRRGQQRGGLAEQSRVSLYLSNKIDWARNTSTMLLESGPEPTLALLEQRNLVSIVDTLKLLLSSWVFVRMILLCKSEECLPDDIVLMVGPSGMIEDRVGVIHGHCGWLLVDLHPPCGQDLLRSLTGSMMGQEGNLEV